MTKNKARQRQKLKGSELQEKRKPSKSKMAVSEDPDLTSYHINNKFTTTYETVLSEKDLKTEQLLYNKG